MQPDTTVQIPLIKGIYTAILTQAGTAAPTAITLQNTIGGTPTWTRTGVGRYKLTITGKFTANKFTIFLAQTNEGGIGVFQTSTNDVNSILVNTDDYTFTGADDFLLNTPIQITFYN